MNAQIFKLKANFNRNLGSCDLDREQQASLGMQYNIHIEGGYMYIMLIL